MFENFRSKPKQETTPVVSENTTENKESLEGQIEQETMKLDANFESLKADIDAMGGVEGLGKKIIENKNSIEAGKIIGITIPAIIAILPLMISLSPGGMHDFAENLSGDTSDNVMTFLTRAISGLEATGAALGAYVVSSTVPNAVKSWWENRKLKSLENKAKAAGIA